MEKQINNIDELIERYIYQVMKNISSNNKKDIEEELKTLILDMLEDKAGSNPPSEDDIKAVLKELGNPYLLSEKYSDSNHHLIGPMIYPTYTLVLKIVLYATTLGLVIATLLSVFTNADTDWIKESGNWVADIINGLLASFAWVTIVFALLERKGVNLNKNASEWDPSQLPAAPSKELSIPITRPIISIIFNIVGIIIIVFAPQILGAYILSDTTKVIPIFNLDVLKNALPIIIFMISLSFAKSIWEIIEQKITMKYTIFTAVVDIFQMILLVILLTRFKIWNTSFLTEQNSLFHIEGNFSYDTSWNILNLIILASFGLIFLLECGSLLYKVLKYNK